MQRVTVSRYCDLGTDAHGVQQDWSVWPQYPGIVFLVLLPLTGHGMNGDVFRPRTQKLKLRRHPQVDKIVTRLLQHSDGGTKAYILHTTSPYRDEFVVNYSTNCSLQGLMEKPDSVCAMHNRSVVRISGAACVLSFVFFLVHFSLLYAYSERFTQLQPSTSSDNAAGPTEGSRDSRIGNPMARRTSISTITRPEVLEPHHGGPNIETPSGPPPASASILVDTTTTGALLELAPEDKIVVMGKLQHENTDWVAEFLPG